MIVQAIHTSLYITENYASKFMILSFWVPARKSPAENGIPKKISGYVTAEIKLLRQLLTFLQVKCHNVYSIN